MIINASRAITKSILRNRILYIPMKHQYFNLKTHGSQIKVLINQPVTFKSKQRDAQRIFHLQLITMSN